MLLLSFLSVTEAFQLGQMPRSRPQIFGAQGAARVLSTSSNPCSQLSLSRTSTARTTGTTTSTTSQLSSTPKLIIFDLDNTVWTPELYQLRQHQRTNRTPVAHRDVQLLPGAQAALGRKRTGDLRNVAFAVASRTKSVEWAHDLLNQFGIRDMFDHIEIFPGNKRQHFSNIADASGIAFQDMLFFDDARDGKYGNCVPVAEMGVLSVHCPKGLHSEDVLDVGLARFREWDRAAGTIVEWDGTVTQPYSLNPSTSSGERFEGQVKFVNEEKRFGFIQFGDRSTNDIFFHFDNLPTGRSVQPGDNLSFGVERDPKNGKNRACHIEQVRNISSSVRKQAASSDLDSTTTIQMLAFSMNMPFAALMANRYKTLETRNGTMFTTYPEGTQMLLHVGRRTYPDGNRHVDIMKSGGLTNAEIDQLKALPPGFDRGMIVAICELGKTYNTTESQRSDPETQRKVAAFGSDSGRMVTEIKRIDYLKRPMKLPAQGGVFKVSIDPNVLPDGWITALALKQDKTTGRSMYSISG